MDLRVVKRDEKRVLEGTPGSPLLRSPDEAADLVEACFNGRSKRLLLYPENLTDRFFDLSSREAGAILQKLRNYQVRLAVVLSPGSATPGGRFAELMVEENRDRFFRLFAERTQAEAWLFED
jgi:hypothetical protein